MALVQAPARHERHSRASSNQERNSPALSVHTTADPMVSEAHRLSQSPVSASKSQGSEPSYTLSSFPYSSSAALAHLRNFSLDSRDLRGLLSPTDSESTTDDSYSSARSVQSDVESPLIGNESDYGQTSELPASLANMAMFAPLDVTPRRISSAGSMPSTTESSNYGHFQWSSGVPPSSGPSSIFEGDESSPSKIGHEDSALPWHSSPPLGINMRAERASMDSPSVHFDQNGQAIDMDPTPIAAPSWFNQQQPPFPLGTDPLEASQLAYGGHRHMESSGLDEVPWLSQINGECIDPSMLAHAAARHGHYHALQHSPTSSLSAEEDNDNSGDYYPPNLERAYIPPQNDWTLVAPHVDNRRASFPPAGHTSGRGGRRHASASAILTEPIHWQSQTTTATKQAAIARRKPGTEAKFRCQYCNESFTRAYNLKGHIRAHNNEKPYKCSFAGCTRAFARSHDLKRHSDLHSSTCKFRCSLCQRPFRRLDALNRHVKMENEQVCTTRPGEDERCLAHTEGHCASAREHQGIF